jgi:hypothetical protein
MADVVQIDATSVHVEFVKDAVIAHSRLEFGATLKAIVRKIVEACAYLIHPALDGLTHGLRQGIKSFGKCGRPDLKRCDHDLFCLLRRVLSGRDFATRLV